VAVGGLCHTGEVSTFPDGTSTPKALIVDWGGVLTDSLDSVMRSWTAQEAFTAEDFAHVMRKWFGADGELEAAFNPVHTLERGELEIDHFELRLAEELSATTGNPVVGEGLLRRLFEHFTHAPAMTALVRRARDRGIRTALLSNSWGDHYPEHLFDGMFDAVVISGRVGMRKPEPEIFHHTADLLRIETVDCVFVDDLEHNVKAAVNLGMIGVHHQQYTTTAVELSAIFAQDLEQ